MSGTTSVMKPLIECPACKHQIFAKMAVDVTMDLKAGIVDGVVPATVSLTGIQVNHDCIPRTTR